MIADMKLMDQLAQEAATGIGDILREIAMPLENGFALRANCPDMLVVDPLMFPLFAQAEALADELGIVMPKIVVEPTLGLHELLETRYWSTLVVSLPEVNRSPLQWLNAHGFERSAELLSKIAQESGSKSPRIVVIGGPRDSELPYVEREDETIRLGSGHKRKLRLNQVYLTPNYDPAEDGPLDIEALAKLAAKQREAILQHLRAD